MQHVAFFGQFARPCREFQADAVGIEEIDRADEHAIMQVIRRLLLGIVVVENGGHVDAQALQARVIFVEFVRIDVERDVVHRSVRACDRSACRQVGRRRDARRCLGRVREPEEGQAVAIADVEEEMLALAAGQVERLDQRHAQDVAVEFDRPRHVTAHEGEVVDAFDFEDRIGLGHDGFLSSSCGAAIPSI